MGEYLAYLGVGLWPTKDVKRHDDGDDDREEDKEEKDKEEKDGEGEKG